MNRGVEIASDVADGPYSVILEQVANGVAVRMACCICSLEGQRGTEKRAHMSRICYEGRTRRRPANGRDGAFDLLIDGDRIARVGRDLPVDRDVAVVEVPSGFIICPGLIDMRARGCGRPLWWRPLAPAARARPRAAAAVCHGGGDASSGGGSSSVPLNRRFASAQLAGDDRDHPRGRSADIQSTEADPARDDPPSATPRPPRRPPEASISRLGAR
jgi:hypothetical protein